MIPTRRTRRWVEGACQPSSNPDVIVFGAPHPLAQLGPGLIRSRTGVPYVVIAHGAEVTLAGAVPGMRQIVGRTFRRAATVLTVSAYTARKSQGDGRFVGQTYWGQVSIWSAFRPWLSESQVGDAIVLVCVSRFVPRKGHLRVIKAAEHLLARGQISRGPDRRQGPPGGTDPAGSGFLAGRCAGRGRCSLGAAPIVVFGGGCLRDAGTVSLVRAGSRGSGNRVSRGGSGGFTGRRRTLGRSA